MKKRIAISHDGIIRRSDFWDQPPKPKKTKVTPAQVAKFKKNVTKLQVAS